MWKKIIILWVGISLLMTGVSCQYNSFAERDRAIYLWQRAEAEARGVLNIGIAFLLVFVGFAGLAILCFILTVLNDHRERHREMNRLMLLSEMRKYGIDPRLIEISNGKYLIRR
jgi:hypothetical protein